MCEGSRTDDLITVLRELDTAKACLRQMQAQLSVALPTLPENRDSETSQAAGRKMNEAAERYRSAVDALDAICQSHALGESERRSLHPVHP